MCVGVSVWPVTPKLQHTSKQEHNQCGDGRCSEERLSDELQRYHSGIAAPKIVSTTLSANPEEIK